MLSLTREACNSFQVPRGDCGLTAIGPIPDAFQGGREVFDGVFLRILGRQSDCLTDIWAAWGKKRREDCGGLERVQRRSGNGKVRLV